MTAQQDMTAQQEPRSDDIRPYALMGRGRNASLPLSDGFSTAEECNRVRAERSPNARMVDLRTNRQFYARHVNRMDALDKLRKILAPGDTVYTVLRHVSRSGMMRHIDLYKLLDTGVDPFYLTGYASHVIGWPRTEHGELRVQGAGMDIGFHAVYTLSRYLFRDGFACIARASDRWHGETCPSNDHSNYRATPYDGPSIHADGGYALRHRWL